MLRVKCDDEGWFKGVEIIKKGGVVVYPTDTVYGVGCDPFNESTVRRVIELKGHANVRKPLPILCSSLQHALRLVELGEIGLKLASSFWPGALTIVAPLKERLPSIVTGGLNKLGVRIPNHPCAIKLIEPSGGFIIGISANKTNLKPPITAEDVLKVFNVEFDILLDGGQTPLQMESTVVEISNEKVIILREGYLRYDSILQVIEG